MGKGRGPNTHRKREKEGRERGRNFHTSVFLKVSTNTLQEYSEDQEIRGWVNFSMICLLCY